MRSLLATLILSTGVPMITAGDELGRTQGGNNNAYCQDDETSWVDWELLGWQRDLLSFTRRLLALRAEHAAFRHKHFFEGRPRGGAGLKDLTWFAADGSEMTDTEWWAPHVHTLGMYLAGDALRGRTPTGERVVDDSFLLVLHGGGIPGAFVLPGRPWARGYRKLLDTSAPTLPEATRAEPGGWVLPLAPRSLVLLQADR